MAVTGTFVSITHRLGAPLTLSPLLHSLRLRFSARDQIFHFIAEEIDRPVENISVFIYLQRLDSSLFSLRGYEIERGILCRQFFLGDTPLKPPQKVL